MRSVLGSTNPLALLVAGLLSVFASLCIRDLSGALLTAGCYAGAGAVLVTWRVVALRLVGVVVAAVSVAYSSWLLGGHDVTVGATAGLRIVVLGLPGAVLAAYVDPSSLGDQLGQRLHLPARFAVVLSAALQRFERLGQTWHQVARARRARGVGPTRNPLSHARVAAGLTFALLVAAMRDATSMAVAMDARGFAHAHDRTWAEPAPWSRTDTAVVLLGAALAAVPALAPLR